MNFSILHSLTQTKVYVTVKLGTFKTFTTMKKLFLSLTFLLFGVMTSTTQAQAQSNGKIIEFDAETHDFGMINEGVVAEHTFTFTNKTAKIITLSNVQASCGCTTPSWSREPIETGKQGKITASYNSEGRPNAFVKTITVTYSEEGQPAQSIVLTIKGNVLAKIKYDANAVNSVMNVEKSIHNFGKIQVGQKVAKTFTFVNTGTADLSISTIYASCNCVMLTPLKNNTIKPNEIATFELVFAPTQVNTKDEVVVIYTNSTTQPQIMITLKAEVVQDMNGQSMLKESDGF